jgi:hypothetical protein
MRLQKGKTTEPRTLAKKVGRKGKARKVATRIKETSRRREGDKHGSRRATLTPQKGQRQPSYEKEVKPSSLFLFVPCSLMGPDGKTRSGWEMRVGDMMFGRADSKETLIAYYTRLHDPLPSGHWRERTWQQRRKPAGVQPRADQDGHEEDEEHAEHEEADFDLNTVMADDGEE